MISFGFAQPIWIRSIFGPRASSDARPFDILHAVFRAGRHHLVARLVGMEHDTDTVPVGLCLDVLDQLVGAGHRDRSENQARTRPSCEPFSSRTAFSDRATASSLVSRNIFSGRAPIEVW